MCEGGEEPLELRLHSHILHVDETHSHHGRASTACLLCLRLGHLIRDPQGVSGVNGQTLCGRGRRHAVLVKLDRGIEVVLGRGEQQDEDGAAPPRRHAAFVLRKAIDVGERVVSFHDHQRPVPNRGRQGEEATRGPGRRLTDQRGDFPVQDRQHVVRFCGHDGAVCGG